MMKKHRILIVDDEARNIKLLKALLENERYEIFDASNGEEALEKIGSDLPDLILLDVMMPGINGFEVCRRLKKNDDTRMIPVVMITALREREHRLEAMEAGADDFLSKPVDPTELHVRVKSLLRIKSYHNDLLKSYQEIAEKNYKLEELEKVKDGLIHMIVHDLRNPLGAISGIIELMLMGDDHFSDALISDMNNCLKHCKDLDGLIQSLLDIHKLEEKKLQLNKKMINAAELIESVGSQFRPKAGLKEITLSLPELQAQLPILVDPDLMKRVIANLLNNAIRHTPKAGKIEVRLDTASESGALRLCVTDNGDGIPAEFHSKIFNKFEQVHLRNTGIRSDGSGLGLTFSKMVVEAHGGKIWVESAGEGEGCMFCILLPK